MNSCLTVSYLHSPNNYTSMIVHHCELLMQGKRKLYVGNERQVSSF